MASGQSGYGFYIINATIALSYRKIKEYVLQMSKTEITIDYIGRRGDGVGQHADEPVFIARALPGETVRATLHKRQLGWGGTVEEILTPSPERQSAPCPHYEACGSCSLQHWNEEAYRQWKEDRVLAALERLGVNLREIKDPVFIPQATRRRATLATFLQNTELRLGYHRMRSHDITDIPDCMVLTPKLQDTINAMRPYLHRILTDSRPADIFIQDTGLSIDVMFTGPVGKNHKPDQAAFEAMTEMAEDCNLARISWRAKDRDEPQVQLEREPVIKKAGPLKIALPPGAFMQPSEEGEKALIKAVKNAFPKGFNGRIAELFSGCGTFTGPLMKAYRVHAVEGDPAAIGALETAAAGRLDLSVARRDLFVSPLGPDELNKFSAIVIDPPRAGAKAQAEQIARSKVPLVISVSCNPSTFARDAAIMAQGGYKLASIQLIDQFLWSAHSEVVGVFRR